MAKALLTPRAVDFPRWYQDVIAKAELAEKTGKNYVSTILSKLEVGRRAEAAAYLARHTGTPGSTDLD